VYTDKFNLITQHWALAVMAAANGCLVL